MKKKKRTKRSNGVHFISFDPSADSLETKVLEDGFFYGGTMTFDADKLETKTLTSGTTYQWNAIKRWEQTTHLYLLYISSNAAIIVPKRAFTTALEEQAFETLLNTKIQNLTSEKYLDAWRWKGTPQYFSVLELGFYWF